MKYIIELPEDYYKAIKEIPIKQSTTDMLIIRNGTPLSEELENAKREIEEIKMKKPLMSRGFECYGFKDKTPEDIKTEIIEMLDNRIAELKGGAE